MKNYLAKNNMNLLPLGLVTIVLAGCVSWRPVSELKEITEYSPPSCSSSAGEKSLSVYRNEDFQFSSLFSWKIERGKISAEAYDAVGRTLAEILIPNSGRKLHGRMTARLPPIAIGDEDFIFIDDRNVGLTSAELSCVLSGNLPPRWVHGQYATYIPGKNKFRYSDKARRISIDRQGVGWQNFCATITVPYFLVFSFETLKICQKRENKISTTIAHNEIRVDFLEVGIE